MDEGDDKDGAEIRFSLLELGAPPPEPEPTPTDVLSPNPVGPELIKPGIKYERHGCNHMGTTVVSDTIERVTCSECGCDLNPYVLLRRIAHREMNFCYGMESLRREANDLRDEVGKLKALRSRLRSDIKKAKTK